MSNRSIEHTYIKDLVKSGIRSWWQELYSLIMSIFKADRIPLIVAISRKMPRILQWLKTDKNLGLWNIEILDKCEIITEIALPFVSLSHNFHKMSVIIVDDFVINGITLEEVKIRLRLYIRKKF